MAMSAIIFFTCFAKILVSFQLRVGYPPGSPQNIEPQWVARKLLQNKELAPDFGEGLSRTWGKCLGAFPILDCAFFSVKVVRHSSGCGSLWKSADLQAGRASAVP